MRLKAAKLQRLRHKNANTKNKYRPGLLLLFSLFSKFFNIVAIQDEAWVRRPIHPKQKD
ncbi:hypothetical protein [Wolbachia endosymbiont of Cimex lectularius]|uniref:hypothetical protein n=1 Tax=Wolbachia endosymbiont of Cimex lectularius TaxID=246273 RepID=UPI000B150E58|nr:hypothetical protein [Wolbachia endosymbiont of Cimex lectularius]